MTINENDILKEAEDRQILHEVVTNEKIVTHPILGEIRLKMPTLDTQRKIDASARARKKYLKEAKDKVEDQDSPEGFKLVPAFRSKEQLKKEYADLGWWTQEQDDQLQELSRKQLQILTELEILNFESEEDIYDGLRDSREKLIHLFKDIPEATDIITRITIPGITMVAEDEAFLKDKATSTEVDDEIQIITALQSQYNNYADLARVFTELSGLQGEHSSLFSDSWQEQLQYYIRLAQIFYCTEKPDTHKPLWSSIDELEKDKDLDIVRWVFGELTAFWQGLSDDVREKMAKYGFTSRQNAKSTSSEDSPALPKSSLDGELQEKSLENSLNPTDIPNPSPIIS